MAPYDDWNNIDEEDEELHDSTVRLSLLPLPPLTPSPVLRRKTGCHSLLHSLLPLHARPPRRPTLRRPPDLPPLHRPRSRNADPEEKGHRRSPGCSRHHALQHRAFFRHF